MTAAIGQVWRDKRTVRHVLIVGEDGGGVLIWTVRKGHHIGEHAHWRIVRCDPTGNVIGTRDTRCLKSQFGRRFVRVSTDPPI